jgi:hypothetical protein
MTLISEKSHKKIKPNLKDKKLSLFLKQYKVDYKNN